MHFTLSEDQAMLRDAVRDALSDACPPDRLRSSWADPDPELWQLLAELGVFGIEVDEANGGLALGPVEATAVAIELGRVGFPGPVLETLAAAPLLEQIGHGGLLEGLVAGEVVVSAARAGSYFPDADRASLLLTVHGARLTERIVQTLEPVRSVDRTRRLFEVRGEENPVGDFGDTLTNRCALLTAAFLVGLSETCLDLAVDYAKQRRQFGKPIGAFQAVQHHLSNALLAHRFAIPPLWRAAWSLQTEQPDVSEAVSAAKAMASEANDTVCRAALQVHGAIGYTFEHDLHLFHKRAIALQRAWGDAHWHRARIARALDLPGAPDA